MSPIKLAIVFVSAAILAGCGTVRPGSVLGSEKGIFKQPEYEVKGATQYDQDWIDENVEAGIAGLGWDRPKPRPPEWDKKPEPKAVPAKPKKKSLLDRFRRKSES